jgi:hypothetical protein
MGGGLMSGEDLEPIAICAPGNRVTAALALMLHGEEVSEIRESSVLEGSTDVLVFTLPEFTPDFPVRFSPEPPRGPLADALRDYKLFPPYAWRSPLPAIVSGV